MAVRAHLAPFLPGHPLARGDGAGRPVVGGALRLGRDPADLVGLHRADGRGGPAPATAVAVSSANYVPRRLRDALPVLYTGEGGLVAHECILDLRPLTKATGVTVDDVAKRLIDYGFHAPTMSFPGGRHPDGRADRERVDRASSTGSATP